MVNAWIGSNYDEFFRRRLRLYPGFALRVKMIIEEFGCTG
jgi:hypothetical protein